MFIRSIVIVSILGVAAGTAAAQTPVQAQVSQETLRQLQGFENNLRTAIERAGAQLGDRARQVVPDIVLRFQAQPTVSGIVLPEGGGMLFMVEVPAIDVTSVMLLNALQRMAQNPNSGIPRIANPGAPPPVMPPPNVSGPVMTEPEREYAEFTRQAFLDAMLDHAFALALKENQTLTLSVGVMAIEPANPLAPIPRRLYLVAKGDDLIALRQNRINRDEAKKRILEFRY